MPRAKKDENGMYEGARGPRKTKPVRDKKRKPSPRYQALIDGTMKVEEMDDEEVFRGKLRDVDGKFRGRKPDVLPRHLHDALRAELMRRWQARIDADLEPARQVLLEIMQNPRLPADARYKSAVYVIERSAGKVPDKTDVKLEVAPWEEDIESLLVETGLKKSNNSE